MLHRNLKVEQRQIAGLIPYARNARTHSDEQVAQIAASIREFGWTNPVLLDEEDGIIAGHGRVLAARKLGQAEVPCLVLNGLTLAQKRAYVLADNKLALNAGWDLKTLAVELQELDTGEIDLGLTGFSAAELEQIMTAAGDGLKQGLTDPDDAPPVQEPVTETGEVWVLGKHRILCGDATIATDVERLLGDVKPHLMVTDPPYGVQYDPSWRSTTPGLWTSGKAVASGKVQNDDRADWRDAWALFPGDVAYVWHGALHAAVVTESLLAAGFQIRAQVVWMKNRAIMSRGHYNWQHEPCWYAVRKNGTGHWGGEKGGDTTIWQIAHQQSETGHGTQKPVECMRRPIQNNSSPGQAIYEPFSGSGTTIIAAEQTARACYAIEIAPTYVDVAVRRWQAFTGKSATLDGDGRTFDEVAGVRIKVAA